MANGDGSIRQLGRNYWSVTVSWGKDPVTGKYRKTERRVHGAKAEARKVRNELVAERDSGLRLDAKDITFGEYAKDWWNFRDASGEYRPGTLRSEKGMIKVLCSYIGNVKMQDLTPYGIKNLLARIREDRGIRNSTTSNYHAVLGRIFEDARKDKIIMANPMNDVKAPSRDSEKRKSLTEEEGAQLLAYIDKAEHEAYEELADKEERQAEKGQTAGRTLIIGVSNISCILAARIGLETGMRLGEVLGLRWQDFDSKERRISVEHSLSRQGGLQRPKTDAGVRKLSIDKATADSLTKWKLAQKMELATLGIVQDGETPVCCSGKGGFMDDSHFREWWNKFRVEAGFPDLKFHELRHTQATLLLGHGFDVKTVQTRMGHASASFTLDRYSHALPENDEKAANFMGNLFSEEEEEQPFKAAKTA